MPHQFPLAINRPEHCDFIHFIFNNEEPSRGTKMEVPLHGMADHINILISLISPMFLNYCLKQNATS
jgi:hypothetical protein